MIPIEHMALNRRARQAWQQASGILLNDSPRQDANEHVGLLAVIDGVRPVALFLDIPDANAQALMRVLSPIGLIPLIAPGPEAVYNWQSPHPAEITQIFRNKDRLPALWVCRDRSDARIVENGIDRIRAGQLLNYPQCCIDAEEQDHAAFEDACIRGCIREFGESPDRIRECWFGGRKIAIEFEPSERIPRTIASFPFVQHIACETCLTQQDSPTALLNSEYSDVVEEVDPALHGYLMRLANGGAGFRDNG